jgi:hypothetical protein
MRTDRVLETLCSLESRMMNKVQKLSAASYAAQILPKLRHIEPQVRITTFKSL